MAKAKRTKQLVEDVAAVYFGATVVCTAHYIE
jgi:hypothetical protein